MTNHYILVAYAKSLLEGTEEKFKYKQFPIKYSCYTVNPYIRGISHTRLMRNWRKSLELLRNSMYLTQTLSYQNLSWCQSSNVSRASSWNLPHISNDSSWKPEIFTMRHMLPFNHDNIPIKRHSYRCSEGPI